MLLTRLHYQCKRFVPWRIRLVLRQIQARRILKNCGDFWPIQGSAGRKPSGWPGGKKFALVDSTLFLLLKGRNVRQICQEKLDWIAECGGMALVNVHPDYIDFGSKSHPLSSYPVAL